jgi:hypothetical protein
MSEDAHEPELHVIKLPDWPGADEWRAERARHRAEARLRYIRHLAPLLSGLVEADDAETLASTVLDALLIWNRLGTDERCQCSCHPHLPESEFHDYGFGCSCQLTAEERTARFDAWMAEIDAFWDSSEGQRLTAAARAEEDELQAWIRDHPEVVLGRHGGLAPEQWWGEVDGHSFYFRERHDHWRIELDLRPSGRHYRAWSGEGDLDDDANFTWREVEEGDVIAEGATTDESYGKTPLQRFQFIVDTIRTHLGRQTCTLHTVHLDELELLLARPVNWCPECGTQLL